jgi:hypothetical protein
MGEVAVRVYHVYPTYQTKSYLSRMDYNPNKLIVRVPTIGHEIMVNLFDIMKGSGTGYPERYGKSSIVMGGSADVKLRQGFKSPDFSLYEMNEGNQNSSEIDDITTPTVVFEVAYTQSTHDVSLEAARHICLTGGDVLLVVVIDIGHERGSDPRELKSVTWSHWEEDLDGYGPIEDADADDVNVVRANKGEGEEEDEDLILPAATAFKAVITEADGRKRRIQAVQTAQFKVRINSCWL